MNDQEDRLLFLHIRSLIDALLLAQAELYENGPRGVPFSSAIRRVKRVSDQLMALRKRFKRDELECDDV